MLTRDDLVHFPNARNPVGFLARVLALGGDDTLVFRSHFGLEPMRRAYDYCEDTAEPDDDLARCAICGELETPRDRTDCILRRTERDVAGLRASLGL